MAFRAPPKRMDIHMKLTKSKCRVKSLFLAVAFITMLVMAVNFIVSGINSDLEGTFTNAKSEECPSFMSIKFSGDTFVAVMNIPITDYGEIPGHISDRIQLSEQGGYFIRIIQQGRFIKTDDVYIGGIALLFPCGGIRQHPFSRTGNGITVGQSHLIALH